MERVSEQVSDGKVLELIEQMLKKGMERAKGWQTREKGTPQGAVISPLLVQRFIKSAAHVRQLLRDQISSTCEPPVPR